nr:hypothetical protein [uncultured Sphaerochaeta sp.]
MQIDLANFEKIGNGAHWDVYRPKRNTCFLIERKYQSKIVVKVSKEGRGDIKQNIAKYLKIKDTNLNTLRFYDSFSSNSSEIIIAEDLNPEGSETIFVSPNTARSLPTYSSNLVDYYLGRAQSEQFEKNNFNVEQYLKDNPIQKLSNFTQFLHSIPQEMKMATENGLGLCEDAFFFGINLSTGTLQYKIADFDTIIIIDNVPNTSDVYKKNTFTMLNSFWEFIDQFVDCCIADKYKTIINSYQEQFREYYRFTVSNMKTPTPTANEIFQ